MQKYTAYTCQSVQMISVAILSQARARAPQMPRGGNTDMQPRRPAMPSSSAATAARSTYGVMPRSSAGPAQRSAAAPYACGPRPQSVDFHATFSSALRSGSAGTPLPQAPPQRFMPRPMLGQADSTRPAWMDVEDQQYYIVMKQWPGSDFEDTHPFCTLCQAWCQQGAHYMGNTHKYRRQEPWHYATPPEGWSLESVDHMPADGDPDTDTRTQESRQDAESSTSQRLSCLENRCTTLANGCLELLSHIQDLQQQIAARR